MADTLELVAGIAREIIGKPDVAITRETDLEAIGADSLDRVEIVMECEDVFGVDLEDVDSIEPPWLVGRLVDAITERGGSAT